MAVGGGRRGWAQATREQAARLRRTSLTDGLTGVLNRRGLIGGFPALVREAERRGTVVGVVLLDVDHFKRINDEYRAHRRRRGAAADLRGDHRRVVGDRGLLARTGGEELAVAVWPDPRGTRRPRRSGRVGDGHAGSIR